MSELGLIASLTVSAGAGCLVGLVTGLVPGLHVNNIAAVTVACAGAVLAAFSDVGSALGCEDAPLMVSCFLVAAMTSHCFSEAVPNTYVGIPAGDAVTALPAHRLAKAGLAWTAVRASMDGSLTGVLLGVVALVPISFLLGPSAGLYDLAKGIMGPILLSLSAMLLLSDGLRVPASAHRRRRQLMRTATVAALFAAAGVLGAVVLQSNYFACSIPGSHTPFVPRSSLLLPLFAGLFGLPTLLLSIGSPGHRCGSLSLARKVPPSGEFGPKVLAILGGILVGWVPGLTSGSSATICAVIMRRPAEESSEDVSSRQFIWLYSAISTAGAVLSVGALFTIARARSGVMEAVSSLLSPELVGPNPGSLLAPAALLFSMVVSALTSHVILSAARRRLRPLGGLLCSRSLAVSAMLAVLVLVVVLTGVRGTIVLATACPLGLIPPMVGVRRIHLMGCLLVPVSLMFLS